MIRITSNSNRLLSLRLIQRSHGVVAMSTVASEGRFFPKTDTEALLSRQSSSTSNEQTMPAAFNKIAFLGVGNMAQAILNPVVQSGLQPAAQVSVLDYNRDTLRKVTRDHPEIKTANSIPELVEDADLVVCAVKPQNITEDLMQEIRQSPHRPSHATFLSVAAGVSIDTYFPTGYDKIVRSMPNTPATIGRGMTVWCATNSLTMTERDRVQAVLSCLGETMYVDDEKQVDMSTAISGSGPAYIFNLMEDMIDAGVHMGFPRDKATKLVYLTLLGSTLFAMETGEHPAILRNNVTSPNGTTASAIYELEQGGFNTAVKDAMWACYRRSLEMGGHDANVGPGRSSTSEQHVLGQLLDSSTNDTNYTLKIERKNHEGEKHWITQDDLREAAEEKWAA